MTKEDLKQYLICTADYERREVDQMDSYELLEAWLEWNGIIGYTEDIKNVVEAAYDITLI